MFFLRHGVDPRVSKKETLSVSETCQQAWGVQATQLFIIILKTEHQFNTSV